MRGREHTFDLVLPHPGRVDEEEWAVLDPKFAEFWKTSAAVLGNRRYEHEGCTVQIEVDWAPLGRRIGSDHKTMYPVRTGQSATDNWYRKVSRPLRLKALCVIGGSNDLSRHEWYPAFFVQYFLYEVFAIANLAAPGAAEFYALSILTRPDKSSEKLELSAFYFDNWMVESLRGQKPAALLLDVEQAANWFWKVNPRLTQKAESRTQRALFGLYHLCKNDGHIDFVMWLFNALESLLSTRVGENFAGLVRRTSLILELDERESRQLNKRFRKLYDLRSSFVHGGYSVAHPLHADPIDKRLGDAYDEILQASKYGFAVFAALLQRMIVIDQVTLEFEERLVRQ